MTNRDVFGYCDCKVIDSHLHLSQANSADDSITIYKNIFDYFDYERAALMVYQHDIDEKQFADNAKALYIRDVFNKRYPDKKMYASGALYFNFDERDTSEGFLEQVKNLDGMGFDGVKILEGKLNLRRDIGRPIDDPVYDRFYEYIESRELPVTMHVAGPAICWDPVNIPDSYRKAGWLADSSVPPFLQFRSETEGLLRKFPKLRLILAHFFFISHDIENAVRIMETYPNVYFDLTPNGGMYADFSECPDEWHEFFVKYADRILYGTDTYNTALTKDYPDYGSHPMNTRINIVRSALEHTKPFEHARFGTILPLYLDRDSLEKIYRTNFLKLFGDTPREVDYSSAYEYSQGLLVKYESGEFTSVSEERTQLDTSDLRIICKYFGNKSH